MITLSLDLIYQIFKFIPHYWLIELFYKTTFNKNENLKLMQIIILTHPLDKLYLSPLISIYCSGDWISSLSNQNNQNNLLRENQNKYYSKFSFNLSYDNKYNQIETIKIILRFNPSCINSCNKNGETPLMYAILDKESPQRLQIIQLLINSNANIYIQDYNKNIAVMWAVKSFDLTIFKLLEKSYTEPYWFQTKSWLEKIEREFFNINYSKNNNNLINEKYKKIFEYICYKKCYYSNCNNIEIKRGQFKVCEKCKKQYYCCKKCQISDWKYHKLFCYTKELMSKVSLYSQTKYTYKLIKYLQHVIA